MYGKGARPLDSTGSVSDLSTDRWGVSSMLRSLTLPVLSRTKILIRYQTLVSDADSSGVDDWGRNRPSRPHTFIKGP